MAAYICDNALIELCHDRAMIATSQQEKGMRSFSRRSYRLGSEKAAELALVRGVAQVADEQCVAWWVVTEVVDRHIADLQHEHQHHQL